MSRTRLPGSFRNGGARINTHDADCIARYEAEGDKTFSAPAEAHEVSVWPAIVVGVLVAVACMACWILTGATLS